MKLNPIVKRDMTVGSRNTRLTVLIMVVNSVLLAVGILGLFGRLAGFRLEQSFDYRGTLMAYGITAAVLFVVVLFLFPSMTAGSISSEAAAGTLDLMLVSGMTPAGIVAGKFLGRLLPALVLLFSCLPALVLPLIYGGVGFESCLVLLLLLTPLVVLLLSIGLFSSAAGKNSGIAAMAAYGIVLGITLLPFLPAFLLASVTDPGQNYAAYLMLLSPALNFGAELLSQIGEGEMAAELFTRLNLTVSEEFLSRIIPAGCLLQLFLSVVFLISAMVFVAAGRRSRKRTVANL